MTKKFDKKAIQEALKAELNKTVIIEAPKAGLDGLSGIGAGIGNMFSNMTGQYKLGKINNQLKRTSERIKVDWEKAEDVATKLATKLGNSSNPQVRRSGMQAAANVQSAGQDIRKATGKLDQMASSGVGQANGENGQGDDFAWQSKEDEFGNKYSESPVERWIRSWGGDMNQLSKADHGRITKQFMNLRAAGLNPFKIPQDKVQPILAAHEYRINQLNATGTDPYPNNQHLEQILGKGGASAQVKVPQATSEKAEEAETQTVTTSPQVAPKDAGSAKPKLTKADVENLLKKSKTSTPTATAPSTSAQPTTSQTSQSTPESKSLPKVQKYMNDLVKYATGQGVRKDMMGPYVANHLVQIIDGGMFNSQEKEYIKQFAKQHGIQVRPSSSGFGGGDFNNVNALEPQPKVNNAVGDPRFGGPAIPPANSARMQMGPNQQDAPDSPIPLTTKKPFAPTSQKAPNAPPQTKAQDQSLNQMAPGGVKASPIRAVQDQAPGIKLPKQQIGEPVQIPKLTDFFGGLPEPADESQLPVPPTAEEQRDTDLRAAVNNPKKAVDFMKKYPSPKMSLKDALPIQDDGKQVTIGSEDKPGFAPPKSPSKSKKDSSKKVSTRKKSSK